MIFDPFWWLYVLESQLYLLLIDLMTVFLKVLHHNIFTSFSLTTYNSVSLMACSSGVRLSLIESERSVEIM